MQNQTWLSGEMTSGLFEVDQNGLVWKRTNRGLIRSGESKAGCLFMTFSLLAFTDVEILIFFFYFAVKYYVMYLNLAICLVESFVCD